MKSFPAKILLFGEYTVLIGSMALAVPFSAYSGTLSFNTTTNEVDGNESGWQLLRFCTFLKQNYEQFQFIDINRFEKEINQGLRFLSNIPQGYGLGSSGALTAAVYDRFGLHEETIKLSDLRRRLASMESFFHGTSSGLDPLVSYNGTPVLVGRDGGVSLRTDIEWHSVLNKSNIFITDTKSIGKTEGLVAWFRDQMEDEVYAIQIRDSYIPEVNRAIEALWIGCVKEFQEAIATISKLQTALFKPMIPESFLPLFEAGYSKKEFYLKLCGSGGGGFMLGFAPKKLTNLLKLYSFPAEPEYIFQDIGKKPRSR